MQSITFTMRSDLSDDRQEAVLRELRTWDGVIKAERLKPDATRPELRRMAYLRVSNTADVEAIVARLNRLDEIESAALPPQRRLV